jgi:hypothetical protein
MIGNHSVFRRAILRRLCARFVWPVAATGIGAGCTSSIEPSHSKPTTLEAVTPVILNGTVTAEVSPSPSVRVRDANGKPMQGVPVQFHLTPDGGTLRSAAAQTDIDGVAMAVWTLGPRAIVSTLTATSHGLPSVVFTATAAAGPASYLSLLANDIPRLGLPGAPAGHPSVDVRDQFDNPVAGVKVTFTVTSGGGTIEADTATTNHLGIATAGRWTLGHPGENTVSASVPGLRSVAFNVTVLAVDGANGARAGTYELESINLCCLPLFKLPSRIVLAENGQFTTYVDSVVGHGVYGISHSEIVFRYSNGFLSALGKSLNYWPPGGVGVGDEQEFGTVSTTAIVLYRCWGEDCYDSYWTYRLAVPPSPAAISPRPD